MTDFELFLTRLGFLPKPTPVVAKAPVSAATNEWHKRGEECPF